MKKTIIALITLNSVIISLIVFANNNDDGNVSKKGLINLGRTSLASVSASSVNGSRPMDDIYHGITNAFDDDSNWHNNLNYSTWISEDYKGWVEIYFDFPVVVTSVIIEAPSMRKLPIKAQFEFSNNRDAFITSEYQIPFKEVSEKQKTWNRKNIHLIAGPGLEIMNAPKPKPLQIKFEAPLDNVKKVRLNFGEAHKDNYTYINIDEIIIIGYVPHGIPYAIGKPRVFYSQRNIDLKAQDIFREWKDALFKDTTNKTTDAGNIAITTFYNKGKELFKIILNKKTGSIEKESLIELEPVKK